MNDLNKDIPFVALFEQFSDNIHGDLLEFKRNVLTSYIKNIDTVYKLSSLKNFLFKNQFYLPDFLSISEIDQSYRKYLLNIDCYKVILFNGVYVKELSDVFPVSINNYNFIKDFSIIKSFWEKESDNPFALLNILFLNNYVLMEVSKDTMLMKPVNIINITDIKNNGNDKAFIPSRLIIDIKDDSKIDIIKTNISCSKENNFENNIVNIFVEKNSVLNYYTLSRNSSYMVNQEFIDVADFSVVNNINYINNRGNLYQSKKFTIQNNTNVDSILSLIGKNNSDTNIDVLLSHEAYNSKSNVELYGVADNNSSVYFKTNVKCLPLTIGTITSQNSKIILKSNLSHGRIEPYQTILTEQAKAFHGAVVSGILDEELFFLESRGISKSLAIDLICNSCLENILQYVKSNKIYDSYLKFMQL